MADREWLNPTFSPEGSPYSFDNLPAALLTLFEVASLEMWGQIMYTACDVVGPGRVCNFYILYIYIYLGGCIFD